VGDPVVVSAVEALNARDSGRWFGLFAERAAFSDDGTSRDLVKWCEEELFGRHAAYIVSVDNVEDGGLTFYARYHSDKWGDFKTFWRFKVEGGRISRLDVGATDY
jgi:hypothetical protein